MPFDFKFDPVTKDFIKDGKGSYVQTEHADTMVMHQLECHAGECWHDDQLGSKLHDLRAFQAKPEVLAPEEVRRSLQILVGRGRIGNLEVAGELNGPGRVDIATKFRDTSTGKPFSLIVTPGG